MTSHHYHVPIEAQGCPLWPQQNGHRGERHGGQRQPSQRVSSAGQQRQRRAPLGIHWQIPKLQKSVHIVRLPISPPPCLQMQHDIINAASISLLTGAKHEISLYKNNKILHPALSQQTNRLVQRLAGTVCTSPRSRSSEVSSAHDAALALLVGSA